MTTIPLAMLVARVEYHENGLGELFGFWYWNPPYVPLSEEGMLRYFKDLMANKSCQLRMRGTGDQIRGIFQHTVAVMSEDSVYPFRDDAEKASEMEDGANAVFVDLGNPKADFVPIDLMVDVQIEKAELIRTLKSGPDILELTLHPDFRAKLL